ncbi:MULTISPECIES: hypothetical protein [Butyricimonas]|uniref:hypothetical protein n=1 Tax=Butyricimonas TaxID=574697 RepID=UPI001D090D88|nr:MULTISPECIES: hypothetical protein [Butyricimonas]MCB6972830.1 hypothetical protein [Butyricimonas synergistica]MCG4518366.1 hypothetical protein [Butyricimonas sp. DFI.6.44]
MRYIVLILLAWGLFASCNDEDAIVPREADVVLRYQFPQGTNEWDEIAEEMKEKHDVYLIYKGFSPLDFSRAWAISGQTSYSGESLTDEQAKNHVKFMKEHIFDYLPTDLSRSVLPMYYFLIHDYRTETVGWSGGISTEAVTNFTGGLDFWANSIYNPSVTEFPATWEKLREHRIRIMKQFLESAIDRGKVVIPASFHDGFNYTKDINTWNTSDVDYYLKRGFLGTLSGDIYNFGSIWGISYTNPTLNFLTYVFLGFRYTEEEFLSIYPPADYPLIQKKRLEVLDYMKEKYNIDLEAIARGPEL